MNNNFTVAVTSLIRNKAGDYLLIKAPDENRSWELPGGHLDENESIIKGLKREIREETGIEVKIGPLVGIYSNISNSRIIFSFLADYDFGELKCSEESIDLAWLSKTELRNRIKRKIILDRFDDLINYNGMTKYRTYKVDPYQVIEETFLNSILL